jgi:hypothetical protein
MHVYRYLTLSPAEGFLIRVPAGSTSALETTGQVDLERSSLQIP